MQRKHRTDGLAMVLAVIIGTAGSAALAHAHLETAQPAAGGKAAVVEQIRLVFSEDLEPRLSSIKLETAEERTVTEPEAQVDPADPKAMSVHLFEKLPPGVYKVRWAAVAKDGHRTTGDYSFLVSR